MFDFPTDVEMSMLLQWSQLQWSQRFIGHQPVFYPLTAELLIGIYTHLNFKDLKLSFRFDKMVVDYFQILLIDVTF